MSETRDQLYRTPRGMKRLSVRSQPKDDDVLLLTSRRHATPRTEKEHAALKEKERSVLKSVQEKLRSSGERVRFANWFDMKAYFKMLRIFPGNLKGIFEGTAVGSWVGGRNARILQMWVCHLFPTSACFQKMLAKSKIKLFQQSFRIKAWSI